MVGMRGNLALLPLACVGFLLSACGDSGTTITETTGHGIEITGTSAADQKMAADLRDYIDRGCRGTGNVAALTRTLDAQAGVKGRIVQKYGSVEQFFTSDFFQGLRRVCHSYERVAVDGGIITVATSLPADDQGRSDATAICNTIQGSDVADFTTHTVVGEGSRRIGTCPARHPP
jgi:hypothetical protein